VCAGALPARTAGVRTERLRGLVAAGQRFERTIRGLKFTAFFDPPLTAFRLP
jgi:hypothetical protein